MVHPDSHKVSRAPWYSGTETGRNLTFRLRGYHPLRRHFPVLLARLVLDDSPGLRRAPPHTPPRTEALEVWAVPRSLAATDGIADLLSFPPGTEMVHFPGFASPCL